jgi:hypothetical protein
MSAHKEAIVAAALAFDTDSSDENLQALRDACGAYERDTATRAERYNEALITYLNELMLGDHGQSERRYIGDFLSDVIHDYDIHERQGVALDLLEGLIEQAQNIQVHLRLLIPDTEEG